MGGYVDLYPMINVGKAKPVEDQKWLAPKESKDGFVAADVTCTANKKGIVQIIGNRVYRVSDGTVTITAKTEDGKTYKLKIDDADKEYKPATPTE